MANLLLKNQIVRGPQASLGSGAGENRLGSCFPVLVPPEPSDQPGMPIDTQGLETETTKPRKP